MKIKLTIIYFAIITFIGLGAVNVRAADNNALSAQDSATIICNNLDEINEYSLQNGGKGNISSCKLYDITIKEFDNTIQGVYIDFNENNGYAVVGTDLTVYDFTTTGEAMTEKGEKADFQFDVLDGYYYQGIREETVNQDIPMFDGYDKSLDGVDSSGTIYDLPKYVADEYGSSYRLYKTKDATTMSGEDQMELSVYKKENDSNGDGIIDSHSSEGNCGLVAPYTLLKFYKYNKGYYDLPYGYATRAYDPSSEETSLYNKKVSAGNYYIYDTEDDGHPQRNFSYLYIEARKEANKINGSPEGLTVWESRDILNNVMANHGYSTRFKIIEIWSMSTVTSRIDKGEAILWSTFGSAYGNHTMFVAGYDIYVKETKILFITYRTYKDFFEIRDGWSKDPRYYDFNGINGGTVLGSFVVEV